jgi:hypothetical protein
MAVNGNNPKIVFFTVELKEYSKQITLRNYQKESISLENLRAYFPEERRFSDGFGLFSRLLYYTFPTRRIYPEQLPHWRT